MATLPDTALVRANLRIPLIVVQDFAGAHQVLVTNASHYGKPGLIRRVMIDGLGHNLFTAQGDDWLKRRRPVAPVFAATELNGLAAILAAGVVHQIGNWRLGTLDVIPK